MTRPGLKDRIRSGERLRGLLVRLPAAMLIDMAGSCGFDFVLLDTEHGAADERLVAEHVTAARAAGIPILVRVGEGESSRALRVLDAGGDGIVVPHVSDAEQAEVAVRGAHYPPRGDRGFATYTAAGRWGRTSAAAHLEAAAATTVVVAMIEDLAGVEHADGIVQTPDLDVVWVGPADLAVSCGLDTRRASAALRTVWATARAAEVAVMAIATTVDEATAAFDGGAQLVVLNAQGAIDRCLDHWVTQLR